jgi:uncharacterized membrane protein (UPF0136 family)
MGYAVALPIAAFCLSFYFALATAASSRTKAAVLSVLALAFFMPRAVPGRQFVVMGLQLLLSIGLLMYFKVHVKGE